MDKIVVINLVLFLTIQVNISFAGVPLVVNTWKFQDAAQNAWNVLSKSNNEDKALDALVAGCKTCEDLQCDFTVGFGGSPDENGETTLDAMIFDGNTMNMGAIGGMRRIKDAIQVARHVLENTQHSLLVGSLATEFATSMGLEEQSLSTNYSTGIWKAWKDKNCQPNFRTHVIPDANSNCGPYKPENKLTTNQIYNSKEFSSKNHDTIGMIVIDELGRIVAGTSTNGANHKIPGRVGDSPIPGAGAYADSEFGAAVATGDGDVMMRFLPSFLAVEQLRMGASPEKAAKVAIDRVASKYPTFVGGLIAVNKKGSVGAACNGIPLFPYSLANSENENAIIKYVSCSNAGLKIN